MNSKQRLVTAIDGGIPDRLPVTTHHLMPYFMEKYMNGMSELEFFNHFGMDPIQWIWPFVTIPPNPEHWRIESRNIPDSKYITIRYDLSTPDKTLTTVIQRSASSDWVIERLLKDKNDIDLIAKYAPSVQCDVEEANRQVKEFGTRGIVRSSVPGFEIYGQPGCWQDAAVLYGIERLILETYDDPGWVKAFLEILKKRKLDTIRTMAGAKLDIVELGGGDASSTVISPKIFDEFVAPYDKELIDEAHRSGQKIAYHTCGGMMPLLERIAGMEPEAMETFTPPSLGGDADLREAKRRIGERVCMIGGFDQCCFFQGCTPEETRQAVRRSFDEAGAGGGFILAPSDHFFDAEIELIAAFADEARRCVY
ncbi:MAG: hypothetical protein KJ970_04740 [Candidatus Eisenbacteria bacterium]|uniref:Uroporphyrinogen decarboxylase (URO-D) domain-containing protein n=1 Tax=Eiseniibacteriota bacterium TaxID=2212470 RepID=A0A948RXT9_UNCEI|nr:hypothetical protein [Candidatus Eisenbacteria bacterium]MBU1948715.1 hypothetical protein [Candidatus Eisenbacteria bacterium]MBU2690214.1 hypothetical protein [Candidatus Eisenbacteria bacterium]